MKKILALDLDDTLLTSDKNISEGNINAINKMLDEGHILAIDSGRSIFAMRPLYSRYDFFFRENVYLLGIQGGLLYDLSKKETLFINYIDTASAIELGRLIKEYGLTLLGFDENYIYTFDYNEDVRHFNEHSQAEIRVLEKPEDIADINLCKIICCSYSRPDALIEFQKREAYKFDDVFTNVFSTVYFLEFIKLGTSKGNGLRLLAERLSIPMADTIACGDERNDISMIEAAGVGVCVCNGQEEARAAADYITVNDNNHDAIAEVIEKFILTS